MYIQPRTSGGEKTAWRRSSLLGLCLILIAACSPAPNSTNVSTSAAAPEPATAALAIAAPESVGIDSARLDRITQAMQGYVDQGWLALSLWLPATISSYTSNP